MINFIKIVGREFRKFKEFKELKGIVLIFMMLI